MPTLMIKTQVGLFAGKWQAVCGMHMEGGERVSKNQRLDFDLEEISSILQSGIWEWLYHLVFLFLLWLVQ